MRVNVAVVGGSGYGGGEILRRLLLHPQARVTRAVSIDHVGESVASAHPNLEGLTDLRFENTEPVDVAQAVDVVFLALPHKVSIEKMPGLLATNARIIDLSGALRLGSAAEYARYYGEPHPFPELMGTFAYGLPELERERVRSARGVANPGCFATSIILGLAPLARRGWLSGPIETVAMTGSSGSGVTPTAGTHHPVRAVNLRTYRPLVHQHTPEIEEVLARHGARDPKLQFLPVSAPLSRGILAMSFVRVPGDLEPDEIRAAFRDAYQDDYFVRVPEKRAPEVAAVAGSNFCEVGVVVGDRIGPERTVTCLSALDNLVKGGAGQAVQNLNVMMGWDETLTLSDPGGFP